MEAYAQLVVRVKPALKERLDRIAQRNDETIQKSVGDALTEWADRQEKKRPRN